MLYIENDSDREESKHNEYDSEDDEANNIDMGNIRRRK